MNKNLLMSVLVIMVAAALINMGTMSYFSDPEVVEDNILQAGNLDLKFVGPGDCNLGLSFLNDDNYVGVDDSSDFSTDGDTVDLETDSFDIFGGTGEVYATIDGTAGNITSRGTRGIGVYGETALNEPDEIDYRISSDKQERIFIEFDTPKWLCKFEVRSLFSDEGEGGEPEVGNVKMWLDGDHVADFDFTGTESTGDGDEIVNLTGSEILVDKIMFYVAESNEYSDYSVSRLYLADYCYQDDDYLENFGAFWEVNHMKPGMNDSAIIVFNEDGDNFGNYLNITSYYQAYEDDDGNEDNGLNPGPEPDTDLTTGVNDASNDTFAKYMNITEMVYYSDTGDFYDIIPNIDDVDGDGYITLYDLRYDPTQPQVPLSANGVNGDYLNMTIEFGYTAGNEFQGDIFEFWIIFTLIYNY